MRHYLIIGGRILLEDKHDRSLITTLQGNSINKILLIITSLSQLICSSFSNDNYVLEGGDKIMRIINKIGDTNISYIEINDIKI